MICGHCKRREVTVQHVKTCSTWHNELKRNSEPPAGPPEFLPKTSFGTEVRSKTSDPILDGAYVFRNGNEIQYVLVVTSRETGRKYAKVFNKEIGRFVYQAGAYRSLQQNADDDVWEPLSLEVAKQAGVTYGVCMVCGRELTNPVSVENGIGPICAGRL